MVGANALSQAAINVHIRASLESNFTFRILGDIMEISISVV